MAEREKSDAASSNESGTKSCARYTHTRTHMQRCRRTLAYAHVPAHAIHTHGHVPAHAGALKHEFYADARTRARARACSVMCRLTITCKDLHMLKRSLAP
eukprot:5434461-Pleurochrysis_carterae.AAC.4